MKTPEEKSEQLRAQLFSKVRWGARDQEVLDWLRERHGITDGDAEVLLAAAHDAKRRAVRIKALITIVFSALGILLPVGFFAFQAWAGVFVVGVGSVIILLIGLASIGVFFRSLRLLLSGHTEGSVD